LVLRVTQTFRKTAFRVPPLGGSGGFSRTVRLVNEPLPPEGGTLNAVLRSSEYLRTNRPKSYKETLTMALNGKRPNILVFMVDEERYPVSYETEETKKWRKRTFKAFDWFREHGIEFHNHYASSAACVPSRA